MNRSFFSRYMIAFAVIILISFLLLAIIIGSVLGDYAVENIRSDVNSSVRTAKRVLQFAYQENGNGQSFSDYVLRMERPFAEAMMFSGSSGRIRQLVLIVTDDEGRILTAVPTESGGVTMTKQFSAEVMQGLAEGKMYVNDGVLDGLFSERHIVSGLSVTYGGEMCGAVFSCSPAANEVAIVRVMNRTIMTACLLVMLAAVIAVYGISNRMTLPLRDMTLAAKAYGRGELDTRVKISGSGEIADLANAFNSMADSIAETEKMRNSFLANVSHDLRTPMTTIAGFVDGMISGAIPKEKQGEYLEIVSSEVHRLSRLVTQILDVSRLESGERKFVETRFDICELARLILISFEQQIDDKRLEVDFSCEADAMPVLGDRDAYHQVLYNLVENAIKFSREGGALRIAIRMQPRDTVEVSVYNEGEGIAEEELPYVFERFYKSDKSRGLDKKGVGLGLYIVKTIVEAMHQTICVESEKGAFCEFRFTAKSVDAAGTPPRA